ncbi:efflux RND transporter periplasmic adaptor subunit [Polluticoccus soli]|uniref:efflux RND transporter periplasmic adaptor subunit n=1 Tax=Polluticoccus soli TaxID=3034150 RepID=UPI0023E2194C|nr:efflux RND transporter periplasmic adaptor subunit [Flavipsychrobacter sp. JY13-12]
MKKKTLWWIIGGFVALLVILIIVGKTKGDSGTKVAVEKVALHTITETVTASGKIYPETEVKISPEVSGEIIELTVKEGDSVIKGQLLVRINPNIYGSVVSQAEAQVEETRARVSNAREMAAQSKAQFAQAQANYTRNKKLYADKVISAMEFEQAEAQYLGAKASYDAAQANISGGQYSVQGASAGLSQARENLRRTTIFAPTSGIISQLNVKLGERVVGTAQMAGTDMLTIADMGRIEVRVDVSETDIAKVKIGDTTMIEADAYRNRKFKGVVSKISVSSKGLGSAAAQMSTDQVTNYTVHILIISNTYSDLETNLNYGEFVFKPGMSASVEIQTRQEPNILSVPVNAVTTRDWPDSVKKANEAKGIKEEIRQVVFVYDAKTKKVVTRDVQTGIQDNQYIQIISGLKAGDEVVIAPYGAIARTLKDKSNVAITKKEKLFESKDEDK